MKRHITHAQELLKRAKTDPMLSKQLTDLHTLPDKEAAHQAVRLGRMRGLYFSEHDWAQLNTTPAMKKSA